MTEQMPPDELIADLQNVHDIYGIDLSKAIRGVAALIEREAVLAAKLNDCEVALAGALRREDALIARNAELEADNQALQKDAERLNWIDATGFSDFRQWDAETGLSSHCIVISEGGRKLGAGRNIPDGIRPAIDAARAEAFAA